MNQQQAFGNILPANSTLSANLIENSENERRTLVKMALQILTGVKDPETSNIMSLYKMVEFLDIEDVKLIMRGGCDSYSDKYNKYPTPFFWKGIKNEVMRKKTAMSPEKIIPKERPNETEREKVSKMAREQAERFAVASSKDDTPNLLTKKFERYRGYIEKDMVRVESKCALFQQWVPRSQADQMGVVFHCPKKWMESRSMGISKI